MLLAASGDRVLRVKGVIQLDDGSFVSVNGVQHTVHDPEHFGAGEIAAGRPGVVLITRGLAGSLLSSSFEVFQRIARHPPAVGV
jgi:hypothetical protein